MAYPRYGGYGNMNPLMPMMGQIMAPNVHGGFYGQPHYPAGDPMWGYFTAVAVQDGEIDAEELQRCLTGIHGIYTPFSLETCHIMIDMLYRDHTGKMDFNEFKELWAAGSWKQNFCTFDHDRSGSVEPHELKQAILSMSYRLNPPTLNAIRAEDIF